MHKSYSLLTRSLIINGLTFILAVFFISGCKTVSPVQSENETSEEAQEALSAVAGAVIGKRLTEEDFRNLEKQIREDEEAQTAVQAITESVGGKVPVVKYCPITGERYAPHMEECPIHHVPLETVEQ